MIDYSGFHRIDETRSHLAGGELTLREAHPVGVWQKHEISAQHGLVFGIFVVPNPFESDVAHMIERESLVDHLGSWDP